MMSSDRENYFLLYMYNNPDRLTFSLGFILWESLHNFSSPNFSFCFCVHSLYSLFIHYLVHAAFQWSFFGHLHS